MILLVAFVDKQGHPGETKATEGRAVSFLVVGTTTIWMDGAVETHLTASA